MTVCGAVGGMRIVRGNGSPQKPRPVPSCLPSLTTLLAVELGPPAPASVFSIR
jgi:hypothetical protein